MLERTPETSADIARSCSSAAAKLLRDKGLTSEAPEGILSPWITSALKAPSIKLSSEALLKFSVMTVVQMKVR